MPPVVLIQEVGNHDLGDPGPGCGGGGAGAAVVDHRGDPGEETRVGEGSCAEDGVGKRAIPSPPSPWRESPCIPPARRRRCANSNWS